MFLIPEGFLTLVVQRPYAKVKAQGALGGYYPAIVYYTRLK